MPGRHPCPFSCNGNTRTSIIRQMLQDNAMLIDIIHPKWFNKHMGLTDNPWDVVVEAETEEVAYCERCNLTFGDLHTTWITGRVAGEAQCPECGASLDVQPLDNDPDYEWMARKGIWTQWE